MYVGRIERLVAYYTPLPMCIVNAQGKVTRASQRIADVFKYDGIVDYDIFALTGIKFQEISSKETIRFSKSHVAFSVKRKTHRL